MNEICAPLFLETNKKYVPWAYQPLAWHCLLHLFLSLAVAMESAGFMNALTSAASAAPVVRKRKRVTTASKVFCLQIASI